jgi:LPS export ABC transporter protein LptC
VAETNSQQLKRLHLRASAPRYVRYAAAALSVVAIAAIAISFVRSRQDQEFRMKGFPTSLSKDVVATVEGYERTEYDEGKRKYYIKADRATTFADNHQELENVFLQVFGEGEASDRITAGKAVYVPEENKNFRAYLANSVNIETRDALTVKTEQVTYKKADESAAADESVEFHRENISGTSFGANVKVPQKTIELLRDVDIRRFESFERTGEPTSVITSGYASYDQLNERIELRNGLKVHSVTNQPARVTDLAGGRALLNLVASEGASRDISTAELFESVHIESAENGGKPTQIRSGYALYEKPADRFDLREAVNIITIDDGQPTTITASRAVYEQTKGVADLSGPTEITQGANFAKGDKMIATLYPSKRVKNAQIFGNGYVRQSEAERTIEVSASELNANFADGQTLTEAHAVNTASAVVTPVGPEEYSKVTLSAPKALDVFFKQGGVLDKMVTDGRTTIQLDSPNNSPDAANKRVTADTVRTFFSGDGKSIQKAEAVGNAELFVEPLKVSPENYKTTINAPRFDCEFYPTGNNAKNCVGGKGTKTVRVPTVPADGKGTQTVVADSLNASFSESSRDVERLDANGDAKFTELDRNGIAGQMSFTSSDGVVRLRGNEPTVWDSRARAKAKEIDWDTKNQKSFLRSGVSTTYYSQRQTGGATPFSDASKPVFVTADGAEFDHRTETAVYEGNARGWQEKSFVRGDRFHIQQRQGQFDATGRVQSLLYDVKRKENGRETLVPVSASANALTYLRDTRLLRYTENVDVRQATDRITGGRADIYLSESNEITRSEFQENVVITQPNRRASAEVANYNASDESVILRGNPARVEDAENGTSQAAQMTIFLRSNRVATEGRTPQNTSGRTRSVYKIKEN